MTVIRPNSISGVTSITAQGGGLNIFRSNGTAGDLTINNIVGGAATFTGVLTYEDVTNVDSIGVITARSGIRIGATGANTLITGNGTGIGIGITTPTEELHIRAATPVIRLEDGDNAKQSKIVCSDGNLRLDADNNNAIADTNIAFRTDGGERLRIGPVGQIGIGGANYGTSGQVLTSQGSGSAVQWATPSSGGMTLLHTMNINMTANTQSQSLNLTGYVKLMGLITGVSRSGGVNDTWLTFNGLNSSGNYSWVRTYFDNSNDTSTNRSGTALGYAYGSVGPGFFLNLAGIAAADSGNIDAEFTVHNLQESGRKIFTMTSRSYLVRYMVIDTRGSINTTSAITSFAINVSNSVSRNTGGTIKLYGFK